MRKKRSSTNIDRYELWTHQTTSANDKVNCGSLSAKKLRKQLWLTHDLNCVLTIPWLRFLLSEIQAPGGLALWPKPTTPSRAWRQENGLTDGFNQSFSRDIFHLIKILHVTSCDTLKKETPKNSQQYKEALLNHMWSSSSFNPYTSTSAFRKNNHPIPQFQGRHSCASKSPWRWSTCPRARSVRSRTWPKQQTRREVV